MEIQDRILRAVSEDGFIQMTAVSTRGLTERARSVHQTTPVVTAALGRTLAAASMIGHALKDAKASVTIRINGGGPIGSIIAVSDSSGNVRGYVQNPQADVPKKANGKLDVGGIVGTNGMLTVIKDLNLKEPYIGSTQLVSGEIAEDFTRYFLESEQMPSAVALGVLVDTDRTVLEAGGYIVSLLPGAPESTLDNLEKNISEAGAVTTLLRNGTAEDIIKVVLKNFNPRILECDQIEYRCYCSRDRVLDAVSSIDENELQDMKKTGVPIEVTCQFCDVIYSIEPEEIERHRQKTIANTEEMTTESC